MYVKSVLFERLFVPKFIMADVCSHTFSIQNEDIRKFPESYFFFAHILRVEPLFWWLVRIMIWFSYVQQLLISFLPIVMTQLNEGMVSFVDKAFYSCLLFTDGAGRRSEDNWTIFGLFTSYKTARKHSEISV